MKVVALLVIYSLSEVVVVVIQAPSECWADVEIGRTKYRWAAVEIGRTKYRRSSVRIRRIKCLRIYDDLEVI